MLPVVTTAAKAILQPLNAFIKENDIALADRRSYRENLLERIPGLDQHSLSPLLKTLIASPMGTDGQGYPTMSFVNFQYFVQKVPHLFQNGVSVLQWLDAAKKGLDDFAKGPAFRKKDRPAMDSLELGIQALRTMVLTAAITAPSDLWLMRQVLATHKKEGILADLKQGVVVSEYAAAKSFNERQLRADFEFLHSRGCIEREGDRYFSRPGILDSVETLPEEFCCDMAGRLSDYFRNPRSRDPLVHRWLRIPAADRVSSGWHADLREMEIGYRLLPLILAMKESGFFKNFEIGQKIPGLLPPMVALLEAAGVLKNGRITVLGKRVFDKGHGAFGIIGAYHEYLNQHAKLLRSAGEKPKVQRAKNILGSRDANRPAFQEIAKSLKAFFEGRGGRPRVLIEHAAGLGIGLQECRKVFGDEGIRYVTADLEEESLKGARRERDKGRLAADTVFVESNIGEPEKFIASLKAKSIDPRGAVMIVGNGFHEARGVSDEGMTEIFRTLQEAGIILVFVEETGLSTEQLRKTAWNTYNPGFRWVHETSGQLLRPAVDGPASQRLSWLSCVLKANYAVLDEYSRRTRRIMPCDLPPPVNPWISVTLFCVPEPA